jgi:hypothetical protein
MYAIEKGIPVTRAFRVPYRYPFNDMEISDSFFVPDGADRIRSTRARCSQVKQQTGKEFIARVVDGGVRVWRVK